MYLHIHILQNIKTYLFTSYFVGGFSAHSQAILTSPPHPSTSTPSSESSQHHRQKLQDLTNLTVSPGGSFLHRTRSTTTVIQPQHF